MPGTFFGVEIARRGLQSQRIAVEITSHNVANANTPGYTRQDPVFMTTNPYTNPNLTQKLIPGQLGTGLEVSQIRRIRDDLLDKQARSVLSQAGFWEKRSDALKQVEAIFPEPSDMGLQNLIGKFFNAWQELNNNPQDLGVKAVVREIGEEMAVTLRQTYAQLNEIKQGLEEDIELKVAEINRYITEINILNQSIRRIIIAGNQPNDLLDRRDLLLDKLSALVKVEAVEDEYRRVDVYIYNQQVIGTDGTLVELDRSSLQTDGQNGALAGLESALEKVEEYMNNLDSLADTIRNQVNSLHSIPAGVDFFAGSSGVIDFEPSTRVKNDLNIISGEQALAIAQLRDTLTMPPDPETPTTTFEGFYKSLVAGIGAEVEGATHQLDSSKIMKEQLENLRQSVLGVSLDEELTRLIQFQYAYQASARTLATMDDILDTLINRLR